MIKIKGLLDAISPTFESLINSLIKEVSSLSVALRYLLWGLLVKDLLDKEVLLIIEILDQGF